MHQNFLQLFYHWFSIWENTHPSRGSYHQNQSGLSRKSSLMKTNREQCQDRNFVDIRCWSFQTRTKLSYTETYLKIIVPTFNDIRTPLVKTTWLLTPIYRWKGLLRTLVYVDNWRQSNFDTSYSLYYNDKIGYETRNLKGSAAADVTVRILVRR
jgi:hypothetical protein